MTSFTRRGLLVSSIALAFAPTVFAQSDYPSKPITFVVPFAAGSATDQLARALGQSITEKTKQPVVVENKAGASGMIAAQAVAKAPADGYTVLITTNTTHAQRNRCRLPLMQSLRPRWRCCWRTVPIRTGSCTTEATPCTWPWRARLLPPTEN